MFVKSTSLPNIMTYFVGFVLFSATLGLTMGSTDCPDKWTAFDGSCYLFGHNVRGDFFESAKLCKQADAKAHLVHVDNALEGAFIKSELRYLKNDSYWVGITDYYQESNWVYFDTNKTRTFTDWGVGEPNSILAEEDCAAFLFNIDYKWADVPCDFDLEPICEISMTNKPFGVVEYERSVFKEAADDDQYLVEIKKRKYFEKKDNVQPGAVMVG